METVKLEKPQWIECFVSSRQYLIDEYFIDNQGRSFFHVLKEHDFGVDDYFLFNADKWEVCVDEWYKIITYERLEDTPERKRFNYLSGLAKSLTGRDIIAIANLFCDNCEDGEEIIEEWNLIYFLKRNQMK